MIPKFLAVLNILNKIFENSFFFSPNRTCQIKSLYFLKCISFNGLESMLGEKYVSDIENKKYSFFLIHPILLSNTLFLKYSPVNIWRRSFIEY